MKITISRFLIFLFIAAGCSILQDNPPDGSSSVELRALGNLGYGADLYSCNKDCYTKLISKIDTNFIINDIQDYSKLTSRASCLEIPDWPSVDFSKNTLLAGVIISPSSCASLVKKEEMVYDSFKVTYTLIVTLQQGSSPTFSAVFFWVLTDKIPSDADIFFEYRYNSIQ
jgi:hypothetical protein